MSPDGFLDTNVVIHAFTHDALARECAGFLDLLETGERRARLEVCVLHELTYMLPRYLKQYGRAEVGQILATMLSWPGVVVHDRELVLDALRRWSDSRSLSFFDSLLISLADKEGAPIYTKNVREMRGYGAEIPEKLS